MRRKRPGMFFFFQRERSLRSILYRFLINPEKSTLRFFGHDRDFLHSLHTEQSFRAMCHLEETRSERSRKPCLLMLLDTGGLVEIDKDALFNEVAKTLFSLTREVDLKGWWHTGSEIGVLFTEIDTPTQAEAALKGKIRTGLDRGLGGTIAHDIMITCRVFPESFVKGRTGYGSSLYRHAGNTAGDSSGRGK